MRRSLYWKICGTFLIVVFASLIAGGATFSFVFRRRGPPPPRHERTTLSLARIGAREIQRFLMEGHRPEELETYLGNLLQDFPVLSILVATGDGRIYGKAADSLGDLRGALLQVVREGLPPGQNSLTRFERPHGIRVIVPLGTPGGKGYVLFAAREDRGPHTAEIEAAAYHLLAILIVAASLGLLAFRALTRRLIEVRQCLSGVAGGDLTLRVNNPGPDEIGDLGRSFNAMAERLQKVVQELESVDRRRRQFLADIAHELKTPVTALRAHLERSQGVSIEDAAVETKGAVSIAIEEVTRLSLLIEDLLELARLDSAEFRLKKEEEVLQRVAWRAIMRFSAAVSNRRIQMIPRLSPEPLPCLVDARRIEQVIANLIQNSIHSLDDEGTLEVLVEEREGKAVIEVMDNGPGIPEEELSRVFQRFYSVSSGGAGTGLGLSIVKRLVEAHGGTVRLEPRSGGGLRAIVELPLCS